MIENRGNALFVVLIAIALFGMLSFAVTQTGRGGGASVLREQRGLSSAQVTSMGMEMQVGVMRMMSSGTSINDIQLHIPGNKTVACTTGVDCLFAPEGGNVPVPFFPQYVEKGGGHDPPYMSFFEIADGSTKSGVADGQNVLMFIFRNINNEVCVNINDGLGLSGMPQDFLASLDSGDVTGFSGEYMGCVETTGLGWDFSYFHVLATP